MSNLQIIKDDILTMLRLYIVRSGNIDLYNITNDDYSDILGILTDMTDEEYDDLLAINDTPSLNCFIMMLDAIYNTNAGVGDCYLWANLCGNGLIEDGFKALYKKVIKEYSFSYICELGYQNFLNEMKRVNQDIEDAISGSDEV